MLLWENISSDEFSPQNFVAKSQGWLATFGDNNDLGTWERLDSLPVDARKPTAFFGGED